MRLAVGLLATTLGVARASAALCEILGVDAPVASPDVPTILAINPRSLSIQLDPDCTYVTLTPDRGQGLFVHNIGTERVASIPQLTRKFSVTGPLSRGGDFTAATDLGEVSINGASTAASAKAFAFPSSVTALSFIGSGIADFASLSIPNGVNTLTIRGNKQLKSLKNIKLPSSVYTLDLSSNQLSALDFALPPSLGTLNVDSNPITTLQGAELPDALSTISCLNCQISTVRGVKLPQSLYILNIFGIEEFEIRESDVPTLRRVSATNGGLPTLLTKQKCADKTATVLVIPQGNVCVISDARFNEVYAGGSPTTPFAASSTTSPSPGSSTSPTTAGSTESDNGTDTQNSTNSSSDSTSSSSRRGTSGTSRASANNATANGGGGGEAVSSDGGDVLGSGSDGSSTSEDGASAASSRKTTRTSSPSAGKDLGATTTDASSSSSPNTTVIILMVVGAAVVAIVGACGYRIVAGTKRGEDEATAATATGKYDTLESPQTTSDTRSQPNELREPSEGYFDNDIRNDKSLSLYRIDSKAVQLGDPIARGGYGVIYRGVYSDQRVAVKQMLPESCHNEAKVKSFMNEIRLCVSLDHAKIVRCIGISWTSLRDLSAVIEFMDGGDLHSVLQAQSAIEQSGREWCDPWTASQLKSKTSIVADVAEAVVYLHSFRSPIIHRDLKAKNVLLDFEGNAKLSDFGISREVPMDETMTREMGTIAWIAPEVLRGERYSEQADIYSLGVLMVEMDRCRHPYSREDLLMVDESNSRGRKHTRGGTASQAVMKNTRIAILVSTGKLRPTPSPSCPDRVQKLIEWCLTSDPEKRPNAMEVHHALRQIRKSDSLRVERN